MTDRDLEELEEIDCLTVRGSPPTKEWLAQRGASKTILTVRRLGGGAWEVGEPEHLEHITPRSGGMEYLALLLRAPGLPLTPGDLGDPKRNTCALIACVRATVKELQQVAPCFGFLLTRISQDGDRILYRSDARCHRVDVVLA